MLCLRVFPEPTLRQKSTLLVNFFQSVIFLIGDLFFRRGAFFSFFHR